MVFDGMIERNLNGFLSLTSRKRFTSEISRLNLQLFKAFSSYITEEKDNELIEVVIEEKIHQLCHKSTVSKRLIQMVYVLTL